MILRALPRLLFASKFDDKFDRFYSHINVTINLIRFRQNQRLENAGKFTREFLMFANFSLEF
ncbi:hypothetical protein [uncultured Campylobacter sp.]|uniref:hypothetical protein n=1 Tax=uncultured Campylobacter sp. TaxID=218934 RepID=UPI00261DD0EB|nr:hypothetical protein [uncultured Campylobacter sp.]